MHNCGEGLLPTELTLNSLQMPISLKIDLMVLTFPQPLNDCYPKTLIKCLIKYKCIFSSAKKKLNTNFL